MILHIGGGRVVRSGNILGVFDMDGHADSAVNREFLKAAERRGITSSAGEDLPRTFILTDGKIILTHISTAAVVGRANR